MITRAGMNMEIITHPKLSVVDALDMIVTRNLQVKHMFACVVWLLRLSENGEM